MARKRNLVRASTFRRAAETIRQYEGICARLAHGTHAVEANSAERIVFARAHKPGKRDRFGIHKNYWWPSPMCPDTTPMEAKKLRQVVLLEFALNLEHQHGGIYEDGE